MKAVILDENDIVTNIAKVADETFATSQGWVVSDTAKIGDAYDPQSGEFTSPPPPPEPIPRSVSRRQAKQQLVIAGLYSSVQSAVDSITDDTERLLAQIYWDDADTFERTHPQLLSIADALSLTSDQIDDMFIAASKL